MAIPCQTVRSILEKHQYVLLATDADVQPQNYAGLQRVQATALAVLEKYTLWIKQDQQQRLIFIDPHGMRLNSGPDDEKVQLHQRIKEIETALGNPNVTLESFIVSVSDFAELSRTPAWRSYNTRDDFAAVHILFEDSDLGPLFGDAEV